MEKIIVIIALAYLSICAALYIASKFVVLNINSQHKFSSFCKHFTLCSALLILGLWSWKRFEMDPLPWWTIGTYWLLGIFFLKRASSGLRMTFVRFFKKNRMGKFTLERVVGLDDGSEEYWGTLKVGKRRFSAQLAIGTFEEGNPEPAEIFIKFEEDGTLDCILVYQARQ